MAPEVKEEKTYDGKKCDIFSLGVILYSIVVGLFPVSEDGTMKYVLNNDKISFEFKDLILKMLNYEPSVRPSINDIKEHPFMKTPFNYASTKNDLLTLIYKDKNASILHICDSY